MRVERRLMKEHVGYSVDSIGAAIRMILRIYRTTYTVVVEFNKN